MRHTKYIKGFTIIEVSVASMLLVVLGAGIVGLQYILGKSQLTSINSFISVDESNAAVSTFIREVRTARPSDNGTYTIISGTATAFSFFSDIDYDGSSEKVRYFLDGTTLKKGVIKPTGYPAVYSSGTEKIKVITENVRNGALPLFTYYNANWPQDTTTNPIGTPIDLSSVRMVRMYIRINTKPAEPETDYVLESEAQIRMLKDNL